MQRLHFAQRAATCAFRRPHRTSAEKVRLLNNKAVSSAIDTACEVRFGQVGLVQLRVRSTDRKAIRDELSARIAAAPQLFERAAACLDLSALESQPDEALARELFDAIRQVGLLPVGVAFDGTEAINALARSLDLPVLTQFRAQSKTPAQRPTAVQSIAPPPPPPVVEPSLPTLMQHQPVRSGQRVYARNRDLIVTTVVGAGAEVMADGCVHIYGTLRGRAMAGARGEVTARVFCQAFHAELVSIAGVFRVFETIPAELAGKPVQAWLDGDDLRFERIGG
jgi:septum site-determining protein MinC